MPRPKRALGYARVSSAEQALGTSLKDQQAAIAAYAKGRGLAVAKFYVEAESAVHEKIERRVQMQALLRDVRAGDLVLCDKLDRWSRDPEFTYKSVREILQVGASFYAVGDQCDPSTGEGDTMLGFRILFAREEHKRIKQRLVGTRKLLRDSGYYAEGLPPLGYTRAHPKGYRGADKNVLVVDKDAADLVRRAFRLCLLGASINRIADRLGLKRDRVADALHNRVYLGQVKNSRGEWIRGRHEPIIDSATFSRVQDALAGRDRTGGRPYGEDVETAGWILRDVARCARCGAKMGAAYGGPRDDRRRHYYRCLKRCSARGPRSNTGAFVLVGPAEAAVEPMVLARLIELRELLGKSPVVESAEPVAKDLAERRTELQRRRERALDAFVDGHMSKEKLAAMMAKIDRAAMKLDAEEHAAGERSPLAEPKARREVLREVSALRAAWTKKADAPTRRRIVNLLVSSVMLQNGAEPLVKWKSPEELAEIRT